MSDRVCICGKKFPYPYLLERHLNGHIECRNLYVIKINNDNNDNNDNTNKKTFSCEYCKNNYANKQNLNRHSKICKSNDKNKNNEIQSSETINTIVNFMKFIMNNNNNNKSNIDNAIQRSNNSNVCATLDNILNHNNEKQELQIPVQQNITNDINNQQINNGTINNTTNNNNGVINNVNITINAQNSNNTPIVYPFGYENINFLTDEEILEILKSPEGSYLVLEKIYSHVDNNNFMKLNNKEKTVSYILSPQTIKLCNDKVFVKMLYEQSKVLLDRLFTKYYINLSYEHQLVVWNNINTIRNTLDKHINNDNKEVDEEYMKIVSAKAHNSIDKKRYKDIKKAIEEKNQNVIDNIKKAQDTSKKEIKEMNNQFNENTIDLDDLKSVVWDIPMSDEYLNIDQNYNNPMSTFYDKTPRYKMRQKLEKTEDDYLSSQELKVGDIRDIVKMKLNRNKTELEEIEANYIDMPEHYKEEIEEILIKKPKRDNMLNIGGVYPKKLLQNTNANYKSFN
jgi:hypothetical protein